MKGSGDFEVNKNICQDNKGEYRTCQKMCGCQRYEASAFHWRLGRKYLNTISAQTSQQSLGVWQCCASIMRHVIFSNLGLTNPPLLLIQTDTLSPLLR